MSKLYFSFLLTLLLTSASAFANPNARLLNDLDNRQDQAEEEATKEELIVLAYKNLEEYSRLHAPDLEFRIGAFEHFYPDSFETTRWADLADLPHGLILDMRREVSLNQTLDQSRSTFRPSWRYTNGANFENPEFVEVFANNVSQMIDLLSQDQGTS